MKPQLPKQIKPTGLCSNMDKNGNPVFWVSACQDHIEEPLRDLICYRYNYFNLVLVAALVASITAVVSITVVVLIVIIIK